MPRNAVVKCPGCLEELEIEDYEGNYFIASPVKKNCLVYTLSYDHQKNNAVCKHCGREFLRYRDYLEIVSTTITPEIPKQSGPVTVMGIVLAEDWTTFSNLGGYGWPRRRTKRRF